MADIFRVNNLTEALNLARDFSSSGQYNLFRGQGQNWPVKSTMARLNKSGREKGLDQLKRLHYYLQTHKPLEKFVSDIDWFYAVAQHYGLPTSYIDFSKSVSVAAFFATNSKSNKVGEDCVIICLQEKDFNNFLTFSKVIYEKDKIVAPYLVKPAVDNLWRLQAQQGCFIYTPYEDLEFFYDFDKIVFPFSEPYRDVPKDAIYPERKSELEILLDHYFNTEKRLEGQKRFKKFAEENNVLSINYPSPDANSHVKKSIAHYSWQTNLFNEWLFKIDEEWENTIIKEPIVIHFSFKKPMLFQIQEIAEELTFAFKDKKINRNSVLSFEIVAIPKLSKKLARIISDSCSRIWDGTRNLPFDDNEIQSIIATYVCLEMYENKLDDTPSITGENLIVLEMTNEYGSITRCYASESKILNSFRGDLNDILSNEIKENITTEILLKINKPNLIFDFNLLLQLFKDELIAYQVLYNSEKNNPVIFYTPTQIAVLGYA